MSEEHKHNENDSAMYQAASAIAPETMDMDISFGEGTVQIRLSNGEIDKISFAVSGSVKVVVADVPVSLTGELTMARSQREFSVPDVVRKVLEKQDRTGHADNDASDRRFAEIAKEMAELKRQQERIATQLRNREAAQKHVHTIAAALDQEDHHLTQWDEEMIRQCQC